MLEQDAELPEDRRIRYRIGINLGEVIVDGGTIYGDGVNVAAGSSLVRAGRGVALAQRLQPGQGQARPRLRARRPAPGQEHQRGGRDLPRRARRRGARVPRRGRGRGRCAGRPTPRRPWPRSCSWAGCGGSGPASRRPRRSPSIAVLPFDNYGGDEATGRLADGLTEDVITDLARFRDLDVIARNSVEAYKGKPADVRQVGKALDVGYVLEGSIQRQADRLRVPRSSSTPPPTRTSGPSAGTAPRRTCSPSRARSPRRSRPGSAATPATRRGAGTAQAQAPAGPERLRPLPARRRGKHARPRRASRRRSACTSRASPSTPASPAPGRGWPGPTSR